MQIRWEVFCAKLLTDKQTNSDENIPSLVKVKTQINKWQKNLWLLAGLPTWLIFLTMQFWDAFRTFISTRIS